MDSPSFEIIAPDTDAERAEEREQRECAGHNDGCKNAGRDGDAFSALNAVSADPQSCTQKLVGYVHLYVHSYTCQPEPVSEPGTRTRSA